MKWNGRIAVEEKKKEEEEEEKDIPAIMGVSIYPGTIAFDRINTPFNDSAVSAVNDRVSPRTPALEAAYGTAPVPAFSANRDDTLMMHFEGGGASAEGAAADRIFTLLRMEARTSAREVSRAPSRFVRRTCEMSDGSVRGRMLELEIPAALTRMSTGCCRM